eukprot:SAG11_NODE_291_length_11180_cov_102.040155_7_plen_96_part_00
MQKLSHCDVRLKNDLDERRAATAWCRRTRQLGARGGTAGEGAAVDARLERQLLGAWTANYLGGHEPHTFEREDNGLSAPVVGRLTRHASALFSDS